MTSTLSLAVPRVYAHEHDLLLLMVLYLIIQAGFVLYQHYIPKNVMQIKHKIPITVYFLGVRGLTTLSCIVCDYTTSGHMDL